MKNITDKQLWLQLRKGNLKRKTDFHIIADPNNGIRTNYTKAKLGKNRKCSL